MYGYVVGLVAITICSLADLAQADDIFYYTSSRTAWVGGGATGTMTPAEGAIFSGFRYFNQGAYINAVSISVSDSTNNWSMYFVGPDETVPVVGDYPNATRWAFNGNGAGLSWIGDGRGDNTSTGNFQVLDATFDPSGNLLSFAADFTQYDEGISNEWNIGLIRYNSSVPLPEPRGLGLWIAIVPIFLVAYGRNLRRSQPPSGAPGG